MMQNPNPNPNPNMARFQPIVQRDQRIKQDLAQRQSAAGTLSPAQQLQRFQQHASDTSWVDDAMQATKHPAAQHFLGIVKQHGIAGLHRYLSAMHDLQNGKGQKGGQS